MNKTVCVTTSDFCFIAENINVSGLSTQSLPAFHSSISSGQVSAFEAFSLLPFDPRIISSLLIVFSLFLSNDHLKMLALQLNFPVSNLRRFSFLNRHKTGERLNLGLLVNFMSI